MTHFEDRHLRGRSLPMRRVVAFAIFSTRRQEEILTIRWADLEPARVLVREMKHPEDKMGNDTWCELVPEAERIVRNRRRTTSGSSSTPPTRSRRTSRGPATCSKSTICGSTTSATRA